MLRYHAMYYFFSIYRSVILGVMFVFFNQDCFFICNFLIIVLTKACLWRKVLSAVVPAGLTYE